MTADAFLAEFVNGAQRKAAARKRRVDIADIERQNFATGGAVTCVLHHPAKRGQWNR